MYRKILIVSAATMMWLALAAPFAAPAKGGETESTGNTCITGDCINGDGTLRYKNGDTYVGRWKEGKYEGKGVLSFKTGAKYTGEFKQGYYSGLGVFTSEKGDVYTGQWLKGKMNGQGEMKYKSGASFKGGWRNAKPHGKGTYVYANKDTYSGQLSHGEPDGKGVYMHKASGNRYEGEFREGKRHGKGNHSFKNGDKYEGQLQDGKMHGAGVSYCATCDGAFFMGQVVGVAGGGDSALDEALVLTQFASRVIIFCRDAEFSGEKVLQDRVFSNPKTEVRWETTVDAILGEGGVDGVSITDTTSGETSRVDLAGIFIYVGLEPNSQYLDKVLPLDGGGHIPTDLWMETPVPGLFAAGDIRQKSAAQLASSAGDGATAAIAVRRYIEGREWV